MELGISLTGDSLRDFARHVEEADRAGLAATVDVCLERLARLEHLGVKRVRSPVRIPDTRPFMDALCGRLLPALVTRKKEIE
jgi:hypothetical protein